MIGMTSTREKGNNNEKEAKELYAEHGWTIGSWGRKATFLPGGRVVSGHQDVLGSDFLAIKPRNPVHFVQVCQEGEDATTSDARKRMRLMQSFPFPADHTELLVMARVKGEKRFRVWRYFVMQDDPWVELNTIELTELLGT